MAVSVAILLRRLFLATSDPAALHHDVVVEQLPVDLDLPESDEPGFHGVERVWPEAKAPSTGGVGP
jgi:hypothetical protein